jgi:hypothetical protein
MTVTAGSRIAESVSPVLSRYVFVVGPGRSGTSLLRRLLNADPEVALAPETHFLDQWLPRFFLSGQDRATVEALWPLYRESAHFRSLEFSDDVASTLPLSAPRTFFKGMLDTYAEQRGASVGGEKTPTHFRYVGRLLDWFPDARVVFILRDVRGTVASLRALDYRWARGTDHKHVSLWRDSAEAALRWKTHPRVEMVRYEDLVRNPVSVLKELVPRLTGSAFNPAWLSEEIGTTSADSWKTKMRGSHADMLLHASEPLMTQLGYASPRPTLPPLVERVRYTAGGLGDHVRRIGRAASHPAEAIRRIRYRRRNP